MAPHASTAHPRAAPRDARARETETSPAIAVLIMPASRRGRQLYDVLLLGSAEVLVRGSRDPEYDAARELRDRGLVGCMTTYRQGSAVPSLRINIARAAGHSVVECATSGPRVDRWRPLPEAAFALNGRGEDGDLYDGMANTAASVDRRVAHAG